VSSLHLAAQGAWWGSCIPGWNRFRAALAKPAATQEGLLVRLCQENRDTAFGKEHGFGSIRSLAQYRTQVPARSWEALSPWLARTWAGEPGVLTADTPGGRIHLFEPSSGSASASKWVPCNRNLLREFQAALAPWIFDLFRRNPGLMSGPAYWSVSPASPVAQRTPGGTPIGFEDDAAYLGGARQALVNRVLCVPSQVKSVSDLQDFRYATLLHLLAAADLRMVSVWSPSFLTLLLEDLPFHWDALLQDLEQGTLTAPGGDPLAVAAPKKAPRRARILVETGPNDLAAAWPRLQLLSCWTDAAAGRALPALQHHLPHVPIQPKGLLATEAFVSLPFAGAHPLAVTSHVLEFETDDGQVVGPADLEQDQEAAVLVSTSGGLYRYRLGDRIRVDGFVGATPSIRFLGKVDKTSDLCGEKLHEAFVDTTLSDLWRDHAVTPRFAMLAPDENGQRKGYTLFVESKALPDGLANDLEERLRQNFHYDHCLHLGQLGAVRVFLIQQDAWKAFYAGCQARGQKPGDVKPSSLDVHTGWESRFQGATVQEAV
jgi:hypothetical protein